MGPNVAGVLSSAVTAGILLALVGWNCWSCVVTLIGRQFTNERLTSPY
ncbi:hypothetical protein O9929_07585 [Vibrio lentus]|nr:hypothetical protein [Vibrio lentus]